jgi:hypothetical protein
MGLPIMPAIEVPSPERFREMLGLPVDPESVLRDVLSRDEFTESPVRSLIDRLNELIFSGIQHVLSWIAKHWPHFSPMTGNNELLWTILGSLFYGVILGLVVAAAVLLCQRVILPRLRQRRTEIGIEIHDAADPALKNSPSRDEALGLALKGHYRDAVIQLFRFVLIQLHERGVLRLHPSRTNREILHEISDTQPLKEPLSEMTAHFNAVRYGGTACHQNDFDRFLGLAEKITRGK